MRSRALLALAPVLAMLAAGCGQDNPRLIPEQDATALVDTVDRIEAACADEDAIEAQRHVDEARAQINELPQRVDDGLQENMRAWLDRIERRIDNDCEAEPEDTPTATPTDTPTATPTETPTATPTATPTETATAEPTVTAEPTAPTTPPGGDEGGVSAPEGEDGRGE